MQNKIKTILIGLGQAGFMLDLNTASIKSHYKALITNNNYDLICCVEKNIKNISLFKKYTNIKVYKSIIKACQIHKPDLAIIASSTKSHISNLSEILKIKSINKILVEKPLDFDFEKSKNIIQKLKLKKKKLFINYFRRSNPTFLNLKKNIIKNKTQFLIKIYYNNGFINNGLHYYNMLRFYYGEFKKFEILNIHNLNKNDFNIDIKIYFEKAHAFFYYKNKNIDNDIQMLFKKNVINNFKSKGLFLNKYKISSNLDNYQKNVYDEMLKIYNKKKFNISDADDHLKDLKLVKKIKNEI